MHPMFTEKSYEFSHMNNHCNESCQISIFFYGLQKESETALCACTHKEIVSSLQVLPVLECNTQWGIT